MAILISSTTDFLKIGVDVGYPMSGSYELTQDIDFASSGVQVPRGWSGTAYTDFTGKFDGKGFSIKNISISADDTPGMIYAGLFGILGEGSEVKNLRLVSSQVVMGNSSAGSFAGSLAGIALAAYNTTTPVTVTNLGVLNGSVTATFGLGGLIGRVAASGSAGITSYVLEISRSFFEGSVTVTGNYPTEIGGLIGMSAGLKSWENYTDVTLVTTGFGINGNVGGFIGNSQSDGPLYIKDCYVRGLNTWNPEYNADVAGFINQLAPATSLGPDKFLIQNCYVAMKNTVPNFTDCYYFIGLFSNSDTYKDKIISCYYDSSIFGGIAGDAEVAGADITGYNTESMTIPDTFINWTFGGEPWNIREIGSTYPDFSDPPPDIEPTLQIRWRNDNEGAWSAYRTIGLGETGRTNLFKRLFKLGQYRTRQYEIVISSSVPVTIAAIYELLRINGEDNGR